MKDREIGVSLLVQVEVYLFATASTSALQPIQLPMPFVFGNFFHGGIAVVVNI
jgi:hypothetical protein